MMISLRSVLFLTSLILITAIPCFSSHTDITPQQAKDLIGSTDTLIIIDVREPSEYCGAGGHIPGALNYPWFSGVLEERYEELINDEILVVCQSGGRSNQAANFLDSKGYTLVYDMLGGMNAWMWETEPCGVPVDKYSGGRGTEDDPYQIATAEDLITLGETPEDYDKYFILVNDIDLDPNLPGRKVFDRAVIAPDANEATWEFEGVPFTGVFDGNRYTVLNITITGKSYLGLFGKLGLGAEVTDLGVVDVNIIGSYYAIGGLVGDNDHGSIIKSYSTGTVTGYTYLGGLVGYNNNGDITESFSNVTVAAVTSGNQKVGGLVGLNAGGITTSYSTGDVTGQRVVGGLVGYNIDVVTMCYSTGMVTGEGPNIGGLVGENFPDHGFLVGCFWDIETSSRTISDGGEGKTTAEMMDPNTFISAGWNFVSGIDNGTDNIWWILEGRDYPRLWWQLPADDFEDGQFEPLWFIYNMEPELVWLEEINGRLQVNTTGAMEDVDAIYVSDGWWLDATRAFSLRVDFHYSEIGAGDGRLTLGLVPAIEGDVVQWAQFEAGTFDDRRFYLYEVRDDEWVEEKVTDRFSDDGILYISYDPVTDELHFSDTDYGRDNAVWTVKGLVRGRWQSESIYITIGGGSEDGMALTGEDAWLDSFVVDNGSILQ
jgi:rhodanese-related sulfurtransferase